MDRIHIEYLTLDQIKPYENNPRNNDNAVEAVAESIKEFGFLVPIVVDKDKVIVAGDTRYKAAKYLGLSEVPTISAEDLTEDQIKAFRLVDNKTSEYSSWDLELLNSELEDIGIDLSYFGFVDAVYSDINLDDVPDLEEETYEEPEKKKLTCPHCGHVDTAERFKKS